MKPHRHVEGLECGPSGECVTLHIDGEFFCFDAEVATWLSENLAKSVVDLHRKEVEAYRAILDSIERGDAPAGTGGADGLLSPSRPRIPSGGAS